MNIPILYEDKDVVVINKPAGIIVHPDGKTKAKTLVDWLVKKYRGIKEVGEPLVLPDGAKIFRPGIVHRIDKNTTGCLIIAKNQKAYEFLKEQFQERKVHKVYHLFVYGDVKEDRGMIDRPIGKSSTDFRKFTAQRGVRGDLRPATTYFRVLKRVPGFTFLEAIPKTGRTHQIRVHFKAVNHPVVMDDLYAGDFHLKDRKQLGFARMALHARELEIKLPSGKTLDAKAPYPADFERALKKIGIAKGK